MTDDRQRAGAIAFIDLAALQHRNLHRRERSAARSA
jgi:hypothetical protein